MRASLLASADRQHVVMKPLLGGLDPKLEPVTLPPGWLHLDQHDIEQDAQVSIAALGYLAQDRTIPGRDVFRDQAEPCGEATPLAMASQGVTCTAQY
jgi:hypothetical protein